MYKKILILLGIISLFFGLYGAVSYERLNIFAQNNQPQIVVNLPVGSIVKCVDGYWDIENSDTAYCKEYPTATETTTAIILPTDTVTVEPSATETLISTETSTVIPVDTETSLPTSTETLILIPTETFTAVPTDTSTVTPTLTSTNTPLPTLTNTSTITPTNTLTPTVVPSTPFASAPLCPNPHNENQWHDQWNSVLGCKYDHIHGVNPDTINTYVVSGTNIVYGPFGKLWNLNGNMGYPFGTSGEANHNTHKHEGMFIETKINDSKCEQQNWGYINPRAGCMRSWRIQIHSDSPEREVAARFHSFYSEIELCNRDFTICGILRGGGSKNDTGEMHMPYKTTCVNPPNSDRPLCPTNQSVWENQIKHLPPYLAWAGDYNRALNLYNQGYFCFDQSWCYTNAGDKKNWENWSTDRPFSSRYAQANKIVGMNWRVYNASAAWNSSTNKMQTICPDSSCNLTNNQKYIYEVTVQIPDSIPATNGVIIYWKGWTDEAGNIKTSGCTVAGPGCVPMEIINVPVANTRRFVSDTKSPFLPGARQYSDGVSISEYEIRNFDKTPADYKCPGTNKRCSWIVIPTN